MTTSSFEAMKSGTLNISLDKISWIKNSPNSSNADQSLYAFVEVFEEGGQLNEIVWYNADANIVDEEIMLTKIVQSSNLNSDEARVTFDYNQDSKFIRLTNASILALAKSVVNISLYRGSTRSRSTDELVGEKKISLLNVITNEKIKTKLHFVLPRKITANEDVKNNEDELDEISIETGITCDINLFNFCVGSRMLVLNSFEIINLPNDWTLQAENDEEALHFCMSPEKNTASYELEILIPDSEGQDVLYKISSGKLVYEPSLEQKQQEEILTSDPPQKKELTGTWRVKFTNSSNSLLRFYSKDELQQLKNLIHVKKSFLAKVNRISVENPIRPLDIWSFPVRIKLQDLLLAGKTEATSCSVLKKGPYPSKDEFEKDLAAATSNDDKKRLQALIVEYETSLQQLLATFASLEANGTSLRTKLTILNAPLHPELPPNPILPSIAVTDLIAQRDLSDEQNKKKNALQDLKSEVRRVIATLLQEYEQLFGEKTSDTLAFGRDERKKKLIFRLNTQGYYHDFKEKLKKRIVPIIREKFLRPEEPQNKVSDPKEYFGELFSYLMSEINIILHDTFYKQQGLDTETIPDASVNEIKSFAEKLRIKALECEVNGTIEKSEWIHLDRIAYIEERAPLTLDLLVSSWYEHALFCLRQGDLDKAGASLHQCLALDPDALLPLFAYGALLCEIQDFSQADTIIKKLVHLAFFKSPNHSFVIRCHGLLAFYYSTCGIDTTGNMALFELLQAKTLLEKLPEYGTVTCAASVWIFLAQTTHELKLDTLTQKILEFANTSIQPRDMIYEELRIQQRVIQAELISFQGRIDESIQLLKEALELDHTHTNVWFAKGKIHMFLENKIESALECFQQALINRNLLSEQSRMSLFMHLGLVFLQSSHYGAAREIFLQSCQEFPVASSWLGVGVASFREEALDLAEMALAEANILDNTNPEVWGYLALLSLNASPAREDDANKFLNQALRYNLSNPVLLRELSNCYVAIDKLEVAEKLLRRSLVFQDSSLTRKTLADVLASQNFAEEALRQYKQSLEDNQSIEGRCELLEQCAKLLVTLGRPEEAVDYRKMSTQFENHITE